MKLFLSYAYADRGFAAQLRSQIEALGAVFSDRSLQGGDDWRASLRSALEEADGVVLVLPTPGSANANSAYFEAGAARALGKKVVAVMPSSESSRLRELPSDIYGTAVFDGAHTAPDALANSIVSALRAA